LTASGGVATAEAASFVRGFCGMVPRTLKFINSPRQPAIQLGHNKSAVWHLRRAVSLDPEDPRFHLALAELYLLLGKAAMARESAEMALRIAPGDVRSVIVCAQGCLATG